MAGSSLSLSLSLHKPPSSFYLGVHCLAEAVVIIRFFVKMFKRFSSKICHDRFKDQNEPIVIPLGDLDLARELYHCIH